MKWKKPVALMLVGVLLTGIAPLETHATETDEDSSRLANLDVKWVRTHEPEERTTDTTVKNDTIELQNYFIQDENKNWKYNWSYKSVIKPLTEKLEATDGANANVWNWSNTVGTKTATGAKWHERTTDGHYQEATARIIRASFVWPEGYDLKDTLRLVSSNEKAGLYNDIYTKLGANKKDYCGQDDNKKVFSINDDVFVFIHTAQDEIVEGKMVDGVMVEPDAESEKKQLLDHLAFWSGTLPGTGNAPNVTFHGKSASMSYQGVIPTTNENISDTAKNSMPSGGWYTFADTNGMMKVLANNYTFNSSGEPDRPDLITPGVDTIYIDFVCFEFQDSGGMDKIDIELVRRAPTAQEVKVNYYLDQDKEGNSMVYLGTSSLRGYMPGDEVILANGTATGALNEYRQIAINKVDNKTVSEGEQVNKLTVVDSADENDQRNTVNVIYRTGEITQSTFVIDYAKELTCTHTEIFAKDNINIEKQTEITKAELIGDGKGTYGNMNTFTGTSVAASGVKYNLQNVLNGIDTFTYTIAMKDNEGTASSINKFINIVPANNIYYEDSFKTDSSKGIVGITYSETGWEEIVSTDSSKNTETSTGTIHGWEENLANDKGDSDGTSMFSKMPGSTATFTFKGTGVDIYSRTNMDTGLVAGMLYEGSSTTAKAKKTLIVDTLAVSNGETGYYQIPTLSFSGLDYGEYTVKLIVSRAAGYNTEGAVDYRYNYHLDGIRVYNPLGNSELYDKAEQNAVFTEIRDILITADDFNAEDTTTVGGPVFIDNNLNTGNGEDANSTSIIATYTDYGPKNEVYLANGQAIVFKVDNIDKLNYYIGLKSPTGTDTTAKISKEANVSDLSIGAASDLYYKVTPYAADGNTGYIMVENTGTALLSVTKLRTAGGDTETTGILTASVDEITSYARTFNSRPSVPYDEPEIEDVPAGDVEIEKPEVDAEQTIVNLIKNLINRIFSGFRNWF